LIKIKNQNVGVPILHSSSLRIYIYNDRPPRHCSEGGVLDRESYEDARILASGWERCPAQVAMITLLSYSVFPFGVLHIR
jgi:hypothetical protein